MESITTFFKEEKDQFYMRGEIKAVAKKSHDVVVNLIVKLGLTDEQAADIAKVNIEFVQEVRSTLTK